ncbi:hypothetical protein AAF712_014200 [Marasmius tenuissimus]|uniref:Uncharacterized protein n=1 Tax=Marasmius tenuissimus TaxID=585030 RepID=A0ABR2ZDU2_9AGAR
MAPTPSHEEEKATAEFKSDVEAWTKKRNEWNAEQEEEINGRIADWEKEKADAERKLAEWRAERDGQVEARQKQRETEEEKIRRETMVPEEVKSEPFEYHFSDADKQSIDMDWDSFYLLLTHPQQMVFQSGFAAGKKSVEKSTTGSGGARTKTKGKAREYGKEITDLEEVGYGPLLPIRKNNTCFWCQKRKAKCVFPDGSSDGGRSDARSMKSKSSEGKRKAAGGKPVHLAPTVEKGLRQINRRIQLLLSVWGVDFLDSSDEGEADVEADEEEEEDREEGPSWRPSKRPASQSPKNLRKKVKSAETIPEEEEEEEEEADKNRMEE